MGGYTGPKMRLARRDGILLPGIGALKRDYPPGKNGPKGRPRKVTQYGLQLREKQKAKRMYGIMERQFRNYVKKALISKGDSAQALMETLERRLDNVVYRLGWSNTRFGSRQMVSHGDILVNGKRVDLPNYQVRIGDVITLRKEVEKRSTWEQRNELIGKQSLPSWLQSASEPKFAAAAKVTAVPPITDAEQNFDPQVIIEFYSK